MPHLSQLPEQTVGLRTAPAVVELVKYRFVV
jgi:hypothetical protein